MNNGLSPSSRQSSSQTQWQPPQKEESAAEAAKKTEKEKAKPKKVHTEEDLAGLHGNGISVVGNDKPAALAQQQPARQMERRIRASYPCPARTRNTGARLAACWTGSPPRNNELRRKKTRSRNWGTAALTSPRE